MCNKGITVLPATHTRTLAAFTPQQQGVTALWLVLGDRSFAAAGPRTWNSLPIQLRDSELPLEQFRRSLKTHLYGHIFGLLTAAAPSDSVFRALGTT